MNQIKHACNIEHSPSCDNVNMHSTVGGEKPLFFVHEKYIYTFAFLEYSDDQLKVK